MARSDDIRWTREALRAQDGKVVPAVVYDADGTRHVIGEAKFHYDETGLGVRIKVDDTQIEGLLARESEGMSDGR